MMRHAHNSETVDADLREAAVLAVVLDAHPGLERKALGQARGVGPFEQAGVQHAHQRRSFAPQRLRTAAPHRTADLAALRAGAVDPRHPLGGARTDPTDARLRHEPDGAEKLSHETLGHRNNGPGGVV